MPLPLSAKLPVRGVSEAGAFYPSRAFLPWQRARRCSFEILDPNLLRHRARATSFPCPKPRLALEEFDDRVLRRRLQEIRRPEAVSSFKFRTARQWGAHSLPWHWII